jgi:hypothetical protein
VITVEDESAGSPSLNGDEGGLLGAAVKNAQLAVSIFGGVARSAAVTITSTMAPSGSGDVGRQTTIYLVGTPSNEVAGTTPLIRTDTEFVSTPLWLSESTKEIVASRGTSAAPSLGLLSEIRGGSVSCPTAGEHK